MGKVVVPASGRCLRAAEAAEYLGVTRQTVYRWIEERVIPSYALSSAVVRVRQADLDEFIASRRRG
jgi:excisionase family DNA binding protein